MHARTGFSTMDLTWSPDFANTTPEFNQSGNGSSARKHAVITLYSLNSKLMNLRKLI